MNGSPTIKPHANGHGSPKAEDDDDSGDDRESDLGHAEAGAPGGGFQSKDVPRNPTEAK